MWAIGTDCKMKLSMQLVLIALFIQISIERILTMDKHHLIGLSLSQCTKDWLNQSINLESIHSIISGTAIIDNEDSIANWITTEISIQSFLIKHGMALIHEFIDHLFKYNKLIQPRLIQSGLRPAYFGSIKWVHYTRLNDWYRYKRINQMCPYCGTINDYSFVGSGIIEQGIEYDLQCNECRKLWVMPFNRQFDSFTDSDWQSEKK